MMKAMRAAAPLLTAMWLSLSLQVHAQEYPSRPIRLVVPWPPGGITDVISRGLGAALSESLGQQIVPDNRPGAAGTLGVSIAAKANPDGYTLLMTDVPSHAISASLYKRLTYNPVKDIEPVALPSRSPLVLVVNPKYGIKTIPQLIDYAKKHSGDFAFASSGPGSITHLTGERFNRTVGIKPLHVPYKGGGPATAALVGGEAGMYFSCISAAIPHIKAGRLTLLGITLPKRSPLYPDTPAVAEAIPGFIMGCNTGFFAPSGTPPKILDRLHTEVMKAVTQPRMKDMLAANAAEPAPYTRAEFKKHVADEVRSWGEVVRASGLKVD
ncbi:MAG: tripartite tricarboxylate transporter substrate binding protein [Betaproteobacteria bacterium]|nr:tripartite tricarboxylate transporter substrate binding protein [Betaproteobacteria bacterium]